MDTDPVGPLNGISDMDRATEDLPLRQFRVHDPGLQIILLQPLEHHF